MSRRRKKEKRRGAEVGTGARDQEAVESLGTEVSLGSGQQHWLPRGLLSAESESNGDSARYVDRPHVVMSHHVFTDQV